MPRTLPITTNSNNAKEDMNLNNAKGKDNHAEADNNAPSI